jgi:hypothetical protein
VQSCSTHFRTRQSPRLPPPPLGLACHLGRDRGVSIRSLHLQVAKNGPQHCTLTPPSRGPRITSSFDTDPIGDTSTNTCPSGSRCTSSHATVTFSDDIHGAISRHLRPPSLESHALSASPPGDLLGRYAHVREVHRVRRRVSTFYPSCFYHQTNRP